MAGDDNLLEMLRRSYFAVDGLWFVMLEEEDCLERAMEVDERVWEIMPKIQARKARELLGIDGHPTADLVRCLALKLSAEGHTYERRSTNPQHAEIVVTKCPWRNVLESAGRTHLGPEIADRICSTEAAVWAREFSPEGGPAIEATLVESICHRADRCRFVFEQRMSD